MMRRGTSVAAAVWAVVTASLLTACSPSAPGDGMAEGERATPPATAAPAPTAVVDVPVTKATPPPVAAPDPEPVRIAIPAIDATLPVDPVGVQRDGSMEIPENPAVAGWYRYGPVPGAPEGSAVVAAHVDSRVRGIGPLARLRELEAGDEITVRDAEGETSRFVVATVDYIPRAKLPVDEFFARTGEPALVIITCGGSFDEATRSYSDNVVAVAHPAG
ncbi:hypothetical protein MICABA_00430 [Microbacterium sp. T2.11-28]|nr:hypothetical protein MICABA_00430 [Microbacterium sp. T2.11-28]